MNPARRWLSLSLLLVGLAVHGIFQVIPARDAVWHRRNGADFASYYYGYKVAAQGGDPYANPELDRMAKAEHSRTSVRPFFYPPPFLFTMAWVQHYKILAAFRLMLVLNELLLLGCLGVLWAGFGVPAGAIGVLLMVWSPIPDNMKMGQANLIALLPALLGLWIARLQGAAIRRWAPWVGGVLLGTAAMFKMSPALFLLFWAMRREWKPCIAAAATAVGLSLLSLPLVPLATQWEFYTEVLPGFAHGEYHGLTVAISLAGNHSIPDIFNSLWPGPNATSLGKNAILASRIVSVGMLAWWFLRARRLTDVRGTARALGALTVLMVILPTYTYEHHLVFLLLPVGVLIAEVFTKVASAPLRELLRDRKRLVWLACAVLAVALAAPPLHLVKDLSKAVPPELSPLVRESKFIGLMGLFFLLL